MPYDLKRIPRKPDTTGAEAARVGEELRDSRLALGLSVEEMAVRLRIRRPYLEALEEGRIADLPGAAYAVGFVRTYAQALGLDSDEMVRRFRDLSGAAVTRKTNLVFPEPVPERGMPASGVIGIGAVIVIGAYVAWFNWTGGGNRTVDVVPPVPPRLEAAAEQGRAQLPGARGDAAGTLPLAALPPPGGIGAPSNTAAQAATVPAAPPPPVVAPAPPAPPPPLIAGLPDGTRVALRARPNSGDGVWLQVRDPRNGQVLLNRVLRPGEHWPVPVRDGLLLDTGKAEGLEIVVENSASPALDGIIGVRRNIALDPDRLRQRLVPATASNAPPQAVIRTN
ncbi:helix-turn-helix domain-containing protein [Roseomonas stagni]|uniref:Helix-turn-helix domain-containing protein n=1 Tax=Falsiroseomonas algicola TaxID=2716930 RepID=A0A6M1LU46_9PROT|nr:helix-turn-helix domain-containing protein [Falsiroseomonas algicola]NGM23529.1 helix-turn-helix domain-containing protein [Falsiroseomonas algicola]